MRFSKPSSIDEPQSSLDQEENVLYCTVQGPAVFVIQYYSAQLELYCTLASGNIDWTQTYYVSDTDDALIIV